MRQIGIPDSLAELGFPEDRLDWAAVEGVKAQRLAENNPVPLTVEAARQILDAAFFGVRTPAPEQTAGGRR